jgi:hypothetical protein
MKNSKKIALVSLVTGLAGTAVIGASAMAATSTSSSGYPDIVQKIADKFHLNPSDVNGVFQQQRTDHMAARHQKLVSALDQAVASGKITKDQETKILAELDTLHQQRMNDTKQDHQADKKALHEQMQQWLKANNINLDLQDILLTPASPMGGRMSD